jgi:hypothetical protein
LIAELAEIDGDADRNAEVDAGIERGQRFGVAVGAVGPDRILESTQTVFVEIKPTVAP